MADEDPVFETTTGPVRVITAASLFDGHDAAINVMRRLIQSSGAEVIHLGHDQSAKAVVDCAVQEDAHAVALTSIRADTLNISHTFVNCLMRPDVSMFESLVAVVEPLPLLKSEHCINLESPRFTHPMMDVQWDLWV